MSPEKGFGDFGSFGISAEAGTAPVLMTVSAIALNFDSVTSDPSGSRADEIRVLLVKNKMPSRKAPEGKPGGFGLPTGQVEGGAFPDEIVDGTPRESLGHAVERETEHETGYAVKKIIGKAFIVPKQL